MPSLLHYLTRRFRTLYGLDRPAQPSPVDAIVRLLTTSGADGNANGIVSPQAGPVPRARLRRRRGLDRNG